VGICRVLGPGGRCPLDGPDPVDLVVDVRPPVSELTAREFGVVCGVRARVRAAAVGVTGRWPELPPGLAGRVTVSGAGGLTCAHPGRRPATGTGSAGLARDRHP